MGSEIFSHYFEGCKLCWVHLGKGKISKWGGVIRKGCYATYLKPLRGDRILCKSSVSCFSFIVDGRMKKKNHETGVLVVVILISNILISNSNIFNDPSAKSVFHPLDHPIIPIPFLFFSVILVESVSQKEA